MFSVVQFARRLALGLPALLVLAPVLAHDSRFYAVELHVRPQESPPALILSWPRADYARQYSVRRKLPAEGSWGAPVVLPGTSTGYADGSVSSGVVYEYEVQLETEAPAPEGGFIKAYSYAMAGIHVPERDRRGRVILVVDSSIVGAIAQELETYRSDLIGAGWEVVQREVSRNAAVTDVKSVIRAEYNAAPSQVKSAVLIGHVPVPYSGNIAPDMHSSHRGAWPADVYYAEMDGAWTDHSVSVRSEDYSENDNFPGDGKFDQSVLPSPAELAVGRIDFWGLPAFQKSEVELLRQYFRKNHQFRHRQFTAPRRGLIRDNFGDLDGDAPAVDAWRHYTAFFGPNSTREVGPGGFFPTLASEGYLWAYGCGGGANDKADGVGSTADFAANDPRAVFLMLHGSYFGDWNFSDNFLRAAIATPSFTLASSWSGLPHWYLHHMALGETIGYSTRASQNNMALYKSHRNFSPAEVHVALIGDPTLEMFPVIPPNSLSASASANVELRWNPSGDQNILGYHIFHAISQAGPYNRLTPQPVAATAFSHAVGPGVHYYMVRAVKLEQTGSGTFRNMSQGIFASASKSSGGVSTPPTVAVATQDGDAAEFRANAGVFVFSRDVVDGNPLTVNFSLGGSAQNEIDYLPVGGSVVIPAWSASATVSIYPRSDELSEGDESVTIQISSSAAYRIGPQNSASLVIRDLVVNQRPVISAIPDQVASFGAQWMDVSFTISDPETSAGQLALRGASADKTIVPDSGIQFGGSGANRTVRITPVSGVSGTAKITIVVSDSALEASETFNVTIPVMVQPSIRSLGRGPGGYIVRFMTSPGATCKIEGSQDAIGWVELGQATANQNGEGQFIDSRAPGPCWLYRVVLRP